MKRWFYLGFVAILAVFIWYWTLSGFYTGRVDVLLGHITYGKARWTVHPFWYVFGMTEWCIASAVAGVMLWRAWISIKSKPRLKTRNDAG
ncbi:hypothetical protein HAQ01_16800 [Acidithiobacillus thiooxidans]|uniref:hypothetical protein n=1 Tax=Acidithiobacillus thiooxidans TaxID=930 RepID=UPI001145AC70|nr:hypothetical protein [Acidithiobacillus thiooxidans]MBU2795007.1 hypothetical protein [Acidithiobacillus thiooxidans]